MGLDDRIFDSNIEERILNMFKDDSSGAILTYYSEISVVDEDKLNKWETQIDYTGYSVAFHTLYPLALTMMAGANPFPLTDGMKKVCRLRLREKLSSAMEKMTGKTIKRKKFTEADAKQMMRESWNSS